MSEKLKNFAVIRENLSRVEKGDLFWIFLQRRDLKACPLTHIERASIIVEFDEGEYERTLLHEGETCAMKGTIVKDRTRPPGQHVEVVFHCEAGPAPDYDAMPYLHHIEDLP